MIVDSGCIGVQDLFSLGGTHIFAMFCSQNPCLNLRQPWKPREWGGGGGGGGAARQKLKLSVFYSRIGIGVHSGS